jgi:hypothetical protein
MNDIVPDDPPSDREQAEYNRIFDTLVRLSPDDEPALVGFISYVYYKIAKREWVNEFYKKNSRHPNDSEIRGYISGWTDSRIDGLKTEANAALSEFSSYVIAKETPIIEKAALQHQSFLRDAFVAFCGALAYSIVLIIFAFVLKFLDVDVIHIFSVVKPG